MKKWRSRKRYAAASVLGVSASRRPWSVLREMLKRAPASKQAQYELLLGERPEQAHE